MRPASIVNFERVVLLSLALGIISSIVTHDKMVEMASAGGMGATSILVIQAISIGLVLLLLWFIARKGSPVAKWIYVAFSVLGLVMGIAGFSQTLAFGTLPAILAVTQYLLSIVALWLLFRPDSKAWFADGRGEPDSDTFR